LAQLSRYSVIVVAEPDHLPVGAPVALASYVRNGGTLLVPEGSDIEVNSPNRIALPKPAFEAKGTPYQLREAIVRRQRPGVVEVAAPKSIAHRALRRGNRVLVHLLNYGLKPVAPFTVRYRGSTIRASALTPEQSEPAPLELRREGDWVTVRAPEFPIHALICFETGGKL